MTFTESTSDYQKRLSWTALKEGWLELYQDLKNDGHQYDWIDDCGGSPLHVAAKGGNVEIIRDLLDHFKHDINALDKNGDTPILIATYFENVDAINFLKNRGADLSIQPRFGQTYALSIKAFGLENKLG